MLSTSFPRPGGTQTYLVQPLASGPVLISSPPSASSRKAARLLPSPLREFDYEPRFPLLLVDTPVGMVGQATTDRLAKCRWRGGYYEWMDSVGVSTIPRTNCRIYSEDIRSLAPEFCAFSWKQHDQGS